MKTFAEYAATVDVENCTASSRVLKLAEETGEVAQVYNKRRYYDPLEEEQCMIEELGDVLYQITALAKIYGWTLADVAAFNVKKLLYRDEMNRK